MTTTPTLARRLAIAFIAMVSAGVLVAVPAEPQRAAASTADFDPGMIITDALFYDSSSMTAAQVQTFLNGKVRNCEPWRDSNPSDVTCLKDYSQRHTAKAADSFCSAVGTRTRTAAQIIDTVARACGISQKALLVLLQKETGLVTHTWPSSWRYDRAMGYACPDTGPGGTANCDTSFYGFFNQVYNAAKQFKRYQANPTRYGYRAGRTNLIQYHPNASCGSASVHIDNQATAALYIYTPYVPNAASLAAGTGTGNSCSSYGNRNFHLFYKSWFGSPKGIQVDSRFQALWQSLGGTNGPGDPVRPALSIAARGGGHYQRFEQGTMYRTNSGIVTWRKHGWAVTDAFQASGGPSGPWGWPLTDSVCVTSNDCTVEFQETRVRLYEDELQVGYPFSDVSAHPQSYDYTFHAAAIDWMRPQGITTGYFSRSGNEYRPLETLTREKLIVFMFRLLDEDFQAPPRATFVDVPVGSEFYREIEWAAARGLTSGWQTSAGAEFRPQDPAYRDTIAAFLYRIAAPEGYEAPAQSPFRDANASNTQHYEAISWVRDEGITRGFWTSSGYEYRPREAILRDSMATFLLRFHER